MDAADGRRSNKSGALYVYDRVCTKESKQHEIHRTYGRVPSGNNRSRNAPDRGERPFGMEFAQTQRKRADAAGFKENAAGRKGRNSAYNYKPGSVGGGEAVKSRPLKLMIDKIVNFFDSVEEKGRRDEAIAKKRAVAWKKLYEYKHIIKTVLVLLAITIVFALLVYRIFFVVKEVEISGSSLYSDSEILLSAGIEVGDNLYSFAGDEAGDTITFLCPYIRSAEIDRTIPKTVAITVEEDTAVYYAVIWGDCVKLSAGLRVLEVADESSITEEDGLIELVLPPVKYSVAGREIEFSDPRNERVIRDVLGEMSESSLAASGMIDEIDLSDEYNITVESMGRYLLRLGDEKDFDLKLKMAYKTMTSDQFDDLLPARIDLTEVGRAAIRPDAALDLSD